MNHPVLNVLSSVLSAARPQIPVLIEITLQIAVNSLSDRVASDVEFSVFVQQWSFAVLLNDVRPFLSVDVRVAYDLFDLTQFTTHCDTAPSVGVFAWLYNPKLSAHRRVLG